MRPQSQRLVVGIFTTLAILAFSTGAHGQAGNAKKAAQTMTDEILEFFGLRTRVNNRVAQRFGRVRPAASTASTFEDDVITMSHARYVQGVTGKEVFPVLSDEIVDGFIVGEVSQSQLFSGLQVSDLVETVGKTPNAKVEQALGVMENAGKDGFVAVGAKGSGKSHIVKSVEGVFRIRRQGTLVKTLETTPTKDGIFLRIRKLFGHKPNATSGATPVAGGEYVITVNPNHRLFSNGKDEQEFIQSLNTLKMQPQFQAAGTIVFHFDNLSFFATNMESRVGRQQLNRYVEMLTELGGPSRKIKFAFETDEVGYGFLQQTNIGRRLMKIDVKEPDTALEQMTVVRRNLAIKDPAGLIQIEDSDLSKLTIWAKRYAPGQGVSSVSLDAIETARSRIWSILKNPKSQGTDDVLDALVGDLKQLEEELAKAKTIASTRTEGAANARARIRQLDPNNKKSPINDLRKQIEEQKVRYKRLKEIASQIEEIRQRAGGLDNETARQELERLFSLSREALTLKPRDLALAMAEIVPQTRVIDILRGSGRMTLTELRERLDEMIVGQEILKSVIMRIARTVEEAYATGKFNANKPLFRVWVSGQPGTGKTEGFKILSDFFDQMVLLNGAEYTENMSKTKLIGSNPGFVNAGEPGALSGPLQQAPAIRLILVDEAESISEQNLELLAQGLDPAVGKDGMGNKIDYTRTVMVFTSNAGQTLIDDGSNLSRRDLIAAIRMEKPNIPAKLMDRMDAILWLDRVTAQNELAQIARKFIRNINKEEALKNNLIKVIAHPRAISEIVDKAIREMGSARLLDQETSRLVKEPILALARETSDLIGKPLKEAISTHRYVNDQSVVVGLELRAGDAVLLDFDPIKKSFFYRILP